MELGFPIPKKDTNILYINNSNYSDAEDGIYKLSEEGDHWCMMVKPDSDTTLKYLAKKDELYIALDIANFTPRYAL